jgi:hypothetical protein
MEEKIHELLLGIAVRLTEIETILKRGEFETRLKAIEVELAALRAQKSVVTYLAGTSITFSLAVLLKVIFS